MRQPKTTGSTFAASRPAPWMKAVFFAQAALFILLALVFWNLWDDAQSDLARQVRLQKEKSEANDTLKHNREISAEFLEKCNKDPDFLLRVARQRLGYTQPGEVVFHLDPPPKPVNPQPDSSGK